MVSNPANQLPPFRSFDDLPPLRKGILAYGTADLAVGIPPKSPKAERRVDWHRLRIPQTQVHRMIHMSLPLYRRTLHNAWRNPRRGLEVLNFRT